MNFKKPEAPSQGNSSHIYMRTCMHNIHKLTYICLKNITLLLVQSVKSYIRSKCKNYVTCDSVNIYIIRLISVREVKIRNCYELKCMIPFRMSSGRSCTSRFMSRCRAPRPATMIFFAVSRK